MQVTNHSNGRLQTLSSGSQDIEPHAGVNCGPTDAFADTILSECDGLQRLCRAGDKLNDQRQRQSLFWHRLRNNLNCCAALHVLGVNLRHFYFIHHTGVFIIRAMGRLFSSR